MFLHGILHRIEGDYDNARMWYSDVAEAEIYQQIWGKGKIFKEVKEQREEYGFGRVREGELDEGQRFLNRVQEYKGNREKSGIQQGELETESRREIEAVIKHCREKFGTERIEDASDAWVENSEEIQKMSDDQINGDKGHRKF